MKFSLKKFFFCSRHQNKIQYFLPIFRVNIAEDSGDVPSTYVSTSESYSVQVPMATSDHDYVVLQESDLSKLELAQAELKRLEEENASLREAKFGLERFYSDDTQMQGQGGDLEKVKK